MMRTTILLLVLLAGVVQCKHYDDLVEPHPRRNSDRVPETQPIFFNDRGLDLPVERDTSGLTDPDDVIYPARNWNSDTQSSVFASSNDFNPFIIGGEDTINLGDRPYICSLQILSEGFWYHTCGSVIMNPDTIVTAGHCLDGRTDRTFRAVCGMIRLFDPDNSGVVKQIINLKVHERFSNDGNRGFPFDIAVMQVESPLEFNAVVDAITFSTDDTNLPVECQIIGWGITDPDQGVVSNDLQEADINRISERACRRVWRGRRISSRHVCFADDFQRATSTCQGDSGGPAVCGGVLVGLTSWGVFDCDPRYPSVFTRVSSFSDWLRVNAY